MRLYTFKDKPNDIKENLLEIPSLFIKILNTKEVRIYSSRMYLEILTKCDRLHISSADYSKFTRKWYNVVGILHSGMETLYHGIETLTVQAYYKNHNIPLKFKLLN